MSGSRVECSPASKRLGDLSPSILEVGLVAHSIQQIHLTRGNSEVLVKTRKGSAKERCLSL